jgi:hypothetical protein
MKFCRDCKHAKATSAGNFVAYYDCLRKGNAPADLVTGREYPIRLCSHREREPLTLKERLFGADRCGSDGRFWEPLEEDAAK